MLQDKLGEGVVVLGLAQGDRLTLGVGVGKSLLANLKAGDIIKKVSALFGGKGGGRPEAAFGAGNLSSGGQQKAEQILKKQLTEIISESAH